MNSRPAASAVCARVSISLQSARQRLDTLVKAVPPPALMENSPSLKPLAFNIGFELGLLACIGAVPLHLAQHAGRLGRTKARVASLLPRRARIGCMDEGCRVG